MEKKSLILGAASGYDWDKLRNWVNSIKSTGYKGDVVIVSDKMNKQTVETLTRKGIILSIYGKDDGNGNFEPRVSNGLAPHVERFFYIWHFLSSLNSEEYDNVIVTDTRDVIFQTDPAKWMNDNLTTSLLIASSEGLKYKNEPWGRQNYIEAMGQFLYEKLGKESFIFNVGVVAGQFEYVRDLMLNIFVSSLNKPISIVDQAVYNYLLHLNVYSDITLFTNNFSTWAIQLGTTEHALKSGSGDIGLAYINGNISLEEYYKLYEDEQPVIDDEGCVNNPLGMKYSIVHQYDRVKGLKEKIDSRYAE